MSRLDPPATLAELEDACQGLAAGLTATAMWARTAQNPGPHDRLTTAWAQAYLDGVNQPAAVDSMRSAIADRISSNRGLTATRDRTLCPDCAEQVTREDRQEGDSPTFTRSHCACGASEWEES